MNAMTCEMLRTIERDATLTVAEREALRKIRRGDVTASAPPAERILRRREVAARCSCSLRTVDRWVSLGLLPRVKLPGFMRASGIPESAVNALIATGISANKRSDAA
jgi:predicted DNA-binding transcriptional regulator AlpA